MVITAFALAVTLSIEATPAPAPAPATQDRPFTQIVQNLGADLRALPSRETAIMAALGAMGTTVAAKDGDHGLAGWAGRQNDSRASDVGDFLGNGWTEVGTAVGIYTVGAVSRAPRAAHLGSQLIRAQILNGLVTQGLKTAVGRTRPNGGVDSFPSGHTSAAFASASILERTFGWKIGVAAYGTAAFVGWSRVRDHVHWLSDVVAGAAIGTVVGRAVGGKTDTHRWTVMPVITKGGVTMTVTKT